ncbi:MAG: DUF4124 domain-containing protein [Pseudomonadota bacterium]|nr:DUF4124 domain-containing protein [Pseudomonadota bacterium]
MTRWTPALLVMALALAASMPAAAQWKWRDKNGLTQYSDLPPPPSVPAKDILQRPLSVPERGAAAATASAPSASAASAAPLAAARPSDPELEARRKKTEQDALDKKKAEDAKNAAIRAENCSRAREQMRTFDSGVRISRTNSSGEREYLDDAARTAEQARTQQAINSECR